jgi:hypothetical protein
VRRERLMVDAVVVEHPGLRLARAVGRLLSRWRFELTASLPLCQHQLRQGESRKR